MRRLRGDFGEKFFDFDMGEDDVGLPLKRFVITPFEAIAFLRRTDEGSGFYQKVLHLNKREIRLIVQEFVNTDDQLRESLGQEGKDMAVAKGTLSLSAILLASSVAVTQVA